MAVTLPTAALSPLFRALGVSLYARLLSQQTPHFPRVYFCFFSSFKLHQCSNWDVKVTLHLENDVDHFVTIVIR